jgi:gas vesicle protein
MGWTLFLAGFLIGLLTGAVGVAVALLFTAPRGKEE